MRILVANKFWYHRGGLERVMFDEVQALESLGHSVAHFSTAHPSNEPSEWVRYFAPYLELGEQGQLSVADKFRAAQRMFYNAEAAKALSRLLDDFRPDVIHIHGIHRQLSPSILRVAQMADVPVVQTLHDYHHVCPADVMLRGGESVCEPRACGRLWYGAAVRHRCIAGSLSKSGLSAAETTFQRAVRAYDRSVDRFIAPSSFMAQIMHSGGWDIPCSVIPNAVPIAEMGNRSAGEYALFAGRLSKEKGVGVLAEAARIADVQLVVAGEGPMEDDLRTTYPEVEFIGRVSSERVIELMKDAFACVVPSVGYENAPMSVLEPMAAGVPVVATRTGGIPELVENGISGILVSPGDSYELAEALSKLRRNREYASSLAAAGRERVRQHFSPERHMERLMWVYEEVIAARERP